jgi:hypothetical protein
MKQISISVSMGPNFNKYQEKLNEKLNEGYVVKFATQLITSGDYHGGVIYILEKIY